MKKISPKQWKEANELVPTASTHQRDLERMLADDKRTDGKIYYKPPGSKRGRRKGFYVWIKYLGLPLSTIRDRYYIKGWRFKDAIETPIGRPRGISFGDQKKNLNKNV